jgi:hypothetical protein
MSDQNFRPCGLCREDRPVHFELQELSLSPSLSEAADNTDHQTLVRFEP